MSGAPFPVAARMLAAAVLSLAAAGAASACEPGPLRLVAPSGPGGTPALVATLLARELPARLGTTVAVDYRPEHSGARAAAEVAESTDGCTILVGTPTSQMLLPATNPSARYDALDSFVPIALLGAAPLVLAVRPTLPARSLVDLIALGRQGALRAGSPGPGTLPHLAATVFARLTRVRIEHVDFADGSPALAEALAAGRIDVAFDDAIAPMAREGRVRALAVTSRTRLALLPDVPTVGEAGVPGFDVSGWIGLFGPPAMDAAFAERVAHLLSGLVRDPGVREQLVQQGVQPLHLAAAAFVEFLRSEAARWRREAGLANVAR